MMRRYYYDLHIHSCLSPCGDDDNTPNNIAGMAALSELNIVALTDHNTCKNCPAFFAASEKYGIIPIAGMELTTSEDIHIVCLFENLCDAMNFDAFLDSKRIKIRNRPEFFGEQLILNGEDELIGKEDFLLSNATTISVEDVSKHVLSYNGVCYPAHIDRDSNGIIAILGSIPPNADFTYFELHDGERISEYSKKYGIAEDRFIVSSDAHHLGNIRDKEFYFDLDTRDDSQNEVRRKLFELLRR